MGDIDCVDFWGYEMLGLAALLYIFLIALGDPRTEYLFWEDDNDIVRLGRFRSVVWILWTEGFE